MNVCVCKVLCTVKKGLAMPEQVPFTSVGALVCLRMLDSPPPPQLNELWVVGIVVKVSHTQVFEFDIIHEVTNHQT